MCALPILVPARWFLQGAPPRPRCSTGHQPSSDAHFHRRPQIALVRLYQSFVLQLLPGQEPLELRTTITMAPKHGVRVTAVPRS